jgi:hypothetical protein
MGRRFNGAKRRRRPPPVSTLRAKAMPPLWQYFSRLLKSHSQRWRPPKGMDPGTVDYFSCKPQVSGGAAVGATMVIMDPGSWARAESAGGAMPPLWQYFSRRQNDDIGNLEQPEARLDQPVALHAAATAAAREGLAVRIDGSPRALLQFDRDLESFPPEVLLRLRKACADATGCCSRSWNTHCLGACGPTADARPTRVQKTGGWPRCERDPAGRTMSSRSFTR